MTVLFFFLLCCSQFFCTSLSESFGGARFKRDTSACAIPEVHKGFVVNGNQFERGSYPWMVALMFKKDSKPPQYFCGGSLISSKNVLTAAHCIQPKHQTTKLLPREVLAYFGAFNLSDLYENDRISLSPQAIELHPEWNPKTTRYDADIAVLTFESEIHSTRFIKPICLWTATDDPSTGTGTVAGWGLNENKIYSPIPKELKVPIHKNDDCFLENSNLADISSKRTFCAGAGDGSGVCFGDSGHGLFVKQGNNVYLKGIVSSSTVIQVDLQTMCDVNTYSIFTNVPAFIDWIYTNSNVSKRTVATLTVPTPTMTVAPVNFQDIYEKIDNAFSCPFNCFYKNAEKRDLLSSRCANDGKTVETWEEDYWLGGKCHCYRCV